MNKNRLEAFSDGVLAIIITIMVLEIHVPHGAELADLAPLYPTFLCYALSFIFIGIYWNNHHHMLQAVRSVNGAVLWANHFLLFSLSTIPFATAWMGENHFAAIPVALYGVPLFFSGMAYSVLCSALLRHNGKDSALARSLGSDLKPKVSMIAYAAAVPIGFYVPTLSLALYVAVAVMWLIPDRRIERKLEAEHAR
jgi:uncharacterized membrane protein